MTHDEAEVLAAGLQHIGAEYTINRDYSGRGMYGEMTCAVRVSDPLILLEALAAYTNNIHNQELESLPDFSDLRVDSMGRGVVIY